MAHIRTTWLGGGDSGHYRPVSTSAFDSEKQHTFEDADEASSLVSSEHPMLSQSQHHGKNYALRYHVPRRRFSRYLTFGLTSIMLLVALFLLVASWRNEAAIRLGLKERPPPPEPQPPPQLPHIWKQFPLLKRYYGGIRTLVSKAENVPEYPTESEDPKLEQIAFQQKLEEDIVHPLEPPGFQKRDEPEHRERRIPKGMRFHPETADDTQFEKRVACSINQANKAEIPQILAYPGVPRGFPDPAMGSYDLFGLRSDICFERYGRLGPYGFGYSPAFGGSGAGMEGEKEGAEDVWDDQLEVDYRKMKWADAQISCMDANKHRFRPAVGELNHFFSSMGSGGTTDDAARMAAEADKQKVTDKMIGPNGKRLVPRTAVVIRTWRQYSYDKEDLFYLRALVNELSLQTGTEYVVHFLIQIHNNGLPIWADDAVYQEVLIDALPKEFRGMGTLWSERQMELIYPGLNETNYRDLPVYGVYRSTYLPLQYFAHQHPQYDFFWHWEMDARYTGHFRHLFDQISQWAKKQPRKQLWERNSRFYVPSQHGNWENFTNMVHKKTEDAILNDGYKPIWGPLRPTGLGDETAEPQKDPEPPTTYERDNYEWGVGEDADFITFNPLFDPHKTNWILAEDVTGYNTSHGFPPRRTAIITASRLSRRLLDIMHKETSFKHHTMFSEMWPGSCALHHGLKAVYAPHPVYVDRRWPTSYLAEIFNNGVHGASGGNRISTFSDERQHNFVGTTWYYHAEFSPALWKRWLGYKVDRQGGERWEMSEYNASNGGSEGQGEGRMCLPAMLLHPVKQVDLVYEHKAGE